MLTSWIWGFVGGVCRAESDTACLLHEIALSSSDSCVRLKNSEALALSTCTSMLTCDSWSGRGLCRSILLAQQADLQSARPLAMSHRLLHLGHSVVLPPTRRRTHCLPRRPRAKRRQLPPSSLCHRDVEPPLDMHGQFHRVAGNPVLYLQFVAVREDMTRRIGDE